MAKITAAMMKKLGFVRLKKPSKAKLRKAMAGIRKLIWMMEQKRKNPKNMKRKKGRRVFTGAKRLRQAKGILKRLKKAERKLPVLTKKSDLWKWKLPVLSKMPVFWK